MIHLRRSGVSWRAVVVVLLTVAITFLRVSGVTASDVFEVKGVKVDVTAKAAAAAREEALAQGEVEAYRLLIERLTLPADRALLPQLTRHEISSLVKEFSVVEEKASTVRYLARLDYKFNADKVRRLLADGGVAYAATVSKPVLVLPVYQSAGASLLWDDPNPWRATWASRPQGEGLVPTVVPLGDLADIAAIGAEQALAGDTARIAALSRRYGTGDTLVARAAQENVAPPAPPQLKVTIVRYRPDRRDDAQVLSVRAEPGEGGDVLFGRAVDAVIRQMENDWKRDNLLRFDRLSVAAVVVPLAALEDWLAVRRRLSDVAAVQRVDLVLLSRDQARVNLYYAGTPGQLRVALAQADLALTQQGAEWLLGLAVAAGPDET